MEAALAGEGAGGIDDGADDGAEAGLHLLHGFGERADLIVGVEVELARR